MPHSHPTVQILSERIPTDGDARADRRAAPRDPVDGETGFRHDQLRPPSSLRWRIFLWMVAIDVSGLLVGLVTALAVRTRFLGETNWQYPLLALIPIYVVTALNIQAYSAANFRRPLGAARRGVMALAFAVLVTVFFGFVFQSNENLARFALAMGVAIAAPLIALGRYAFIRNLDRIVGGNPFRVILIRDKDQPIPKGAYSSIVPADRFFDPEKHDPIMYDRLARVTQSAHRVVIACRPERRDAWAFALKSAGIQGEVLMPELAALAPLDMARCGKDFTMVVAVGPLGLADRAAKRMFDLAFASLALLALSPVLIAVAVAIKLDTRGPVFFLQDRIGRGNKIFRIRKFRSMRVEKSDGAGHTSTARDDARITRVGRFIRRTSLDELPQLFNVLAGCMSVVGPRPHALGSRAADKLFWEIDRRYWHRHATKPGLTGLAQVRGFRGATVKEADLANRLQADLEYLEDWSLWRDVKLVLLTLRVILHRNAF